MEVAGANRRWSSQFRCRGSRRESAVAQLFSLGGKSVHEHRASETEQTEARVDLDFSRDLSLDYFGDLRLHSCQQFTPRHVV